MGKIRYYCEYCERSFLDDLKARKKHLSGTQHLRMRKQYYHPFRTAKEVYEEERQKDPCRKFLMQNMCPFGDNCRYSHYHPHELERLRQEADLQTCLSSGSTTVQSMNEALAKMPSDEKIQNWLAVWEAKQKEESLKPAKPAVQAVSKAWCTDLPTELQGWRELPPSLQPWSRFNLQNVYLEDWG